MSRQLITSILLVLCGAFLVAPATANGLTELEQLGKDLFFDNNLSTPPGQSCAACHAPTTAFAGPISEINAHGAVYPGAVFNRFGNRKPPAAAYASFSPVFYFDEVEGIYIGGVFWDGRADDVVEQAKGPFLNPVEQNNPNMRSVIIKILRSDYADQFNALFAQWLMDQSMTENAIPELVFDVGDPGYIANAYQFMAEAIGTYEASSEVNQFSSKYDAYLAGTAELTPMEAWGLELYEGKAMCNACHPSEPGPGGEPPLFTDFTYDNLGVPKNPENPWYTMPPGFNPDGADWVDLGLGGRLGDPELYGAVKVPTLRNVGMKPYPEFVQAYMHNGFFKNLKDVVHFYNTRDVENWPPPEVPENVNEDELGDLGLTSEEEDAIVAFMNTLTDGWTNGAAPVARTQIAPRLLLGGSFPNPFQGSTRIRFTVPERLPVTLTVFDVQGRRVRELLAARDLSGPQQVVWDARDDFGRSVSPGVYFYGLQAGPNRQVQRVVLLP